MRTPRTSTSCLTNDMVQFGSQSRHARTRTGGAPSSTIYPVALEMTEWADQEGAPFRQPAGAPRVSGRPHLVSVCAGRCAGLTHQAHAHPARRRDPAPLHDPVKVAEQIAVLDLVSGGRLTSRIGAGYVEREFEMFGVTLQRSRAPAERRHPDHPARAVRRAILRTIGREIYEAPVAAPERSHTRRSTSAAVLKRPRVAQLSFGLCTRTPLKMDIVPLYEAECRKLGREPGRVDGQRGLGSYVSDDATGGDVGIRSLPACRPRGERSYAEGRARGLRVAAQGPHTIEDVKASGWYRVLTPDQCVALRRGKRTAEPRRRFSLP